MESVRFTTSSLCPPLGLGYVASALEAAGERVRVIDAVGLAPTRFTPFHKGFLVGLDLDAIVDRVDPRSLIVGISAIFTHEWPAVVELITRLKRARPACFILVGGEHVTSMPEFSLASSDADALVLGEGEETAVEIARAVREGRPLDGIAGAAFRRGRRIHVNPRRARRADIDAIAPPAWRHFDLAAYHRERYAGGVYTGKPTVPILATRGCPYQCTYCSSPNMWTTQWTARNPKLVVDEIESYVRDFGAGNFPFQDLTAILRKDWIEAFCRELLARDLGITWQLPSGTRSEAIDAKVAALLKASGMLSMSYAPESGSDETRRRIKKHMSTDKVLESVRAASRAGLSVSIFLVLGFPHDRSEQLAENLPFVERAAEAGASDVAIGYYMALPGTELFRSLYEAGRIKLDRSYFQHILHGIAFVPLQTYCDLGRARLLAWKLRTYWRFYSRALKDRTAGSKLPTALRYGARNFLLAARGWLRPRWVSRTREREMFAPWDALFARIYEGRRRAGLQPKAPSPEVFSSGNVVAEVRRDHATAKTFDLIEETKPTWSSVPLFPVPSAPTG